MEINQINNLLLKENIHKLLEMCASTTNKGIYKLIYILPNFKSWHI